jgi:hypothetical protein
MTPPSDERLRRLAMGTLDANRQQAHTVPSRTLYPHQWSWDAGFIAVGLARYAPDSAWSELRSLFGAQWADGRVPHIAFDPTDGDRHYYPGPRFWRSDLAEWAPRRPTSGIVQPPVHALAAWEIYRSAPEATARAVGAAELRWLYPRLVAQQHYLAACRDVGGGGLACLVHPWESGQDNSPAWDAALAAVPADRVVPGYRADLEVSVPSHRPTDADYARYLLIAQCYREHRYVDDGPGDRYLFLVEDPAFNAVYAAAEHALARIAGVIGADPAPHRVHAARVTRALVERLYDPATGMFHALDLYTGALSPARCAGGLLPLILPGLPDAQVKSLLAEATSARFGLGTNPLAVPSYDRTAPDRDPERYWRGPVWVNMNWLLWRGLREHGQVELAETLRQGTIALVRDAGFYEYFHPETGAGIGTAEFSWTAALILDLLAS